MDFSTFHCPRWDELPDLALYMDQVLLVVNGAFAPVTGGAPPVTASMINNYVKLKLTDPAVKKKYSRAHLARFMMICLLKRVLSMQEIAAVLDQLLRQGGLEAGYDCFGRVLERLLADPAAEPGETCPAVVTAALRAVAAKLWVEQYLHEKTP